MSEKQTTGPVTTKYGLMCIGVGVQCKHLLVYDWHYPYCTAQPNTAPGFRIGTHLHLAIPNEGCPFNKTTDVAPQ